jgi:hypothetical protein
MGYTCRWDAVPNENGSLDKEIRPLTYCRHRDTGEYAWRWRHFDRPRPLYGLDKLAARPDAPVLDVEGEKTADAAQALLPDYVVVTSPGGARAAHLADWSPLNGRQGATWPDNDVDGRERASVVVKACKASGGAIGPVKVPDGLTDKWDLADPLPEGWTFETVRKLIADAQKASPPSRGPLTESFRVGEDGVYFIEDRNGEQTETWLCSPLRIRALTRTTDSEEWGRLLEVVDPDGCEHVWAMPMSMLAGDGAELRAQLLSLGLGLAQGRTGRERLQQYLTTACPEERARCVSQTGWHGGVYVLSDRVIGATT